MKILMHYALFPRKDGKVWNSKGSDNTFLDLYKVTPPLFSTHHELGNVLLHDDENNTSEYPPTCIFGQDSPPDRTYPSFVNIPSNRITGI